MLKKKYELRKGGEEVTDQQTLHLSAAVKEKTKHKQQQHFSTLYPLQNVKYAAIFVKKGIKHMQVFAF